jgi:exosortase H (IPTLxxWG-CTERM-specific)
MSRPPKRKARTLPTGSTGRRVEPPARSPAAKPGWRAWFAARAPALRFLVVFALLLGGFYAVILLPAADRAFYQCLCLNARAANAILQGMGQATSVSEVTIRSAQYAVAIRRGCDAIEPAWFFCAAVLAFPGRWRRKPAGLTVGVIAILALNLVRIVSLYFIGLHLRWLFPTAHLELWPVVFILAALGLWIAWIRWSREEVRPPNHAAT